MGFSYKRSARHVPRGEASRGRRNARRWYAKMTPAAETKVVSVSTKSSSEVGPRVPQTRSDGAPAIKGETYLSHNFISGVPAPTSDTLEATVSEGLARRGCPNKVEGSDTSVGLPTRTQYALDRILLADRQHTWCDAEQHGSQCASTLSRTSSPPSPPNAASIPNAVQGCDEPHTYGQSEDRELLLEACVTDPTIRAIVINGSRLRRLDTFAWVYDCCGAMCLGPPDRIPLIAQELKYAPQGLIDALALDPKTAGEACLLQEKRERWLNSHSQYRIHNARTVLLSTTLLPELDEVHLLTLIPESEKSDRPIKRLPKRPVDPAKIRLPDGEDDDDHRAGNIVKVKAALASLVPIDPPRYVEPDVPVGAHRISGTVVKDALPEFFRYCACGERVTLPGTVKDFIIEPRLDGDRLTDAVARFKAAQETILGLWRVSMRSMFEPERISSEPCIGNCGLVTHVKFARAVHGRRLPRESNHEPTLFGCGISYANNLGVARELAITSAKVYADHLFVCIASVLGVLKDKPTWSKSLFDELLERAVGSLDSRGSGKFDYPGLVPLDVDVYMPEIFSLYLCRKLLNVTRPDKLVEAEEKFLERVVERTDDPADPQDVQIALSRARAAAEALFRPCNDPLPPCPNSGKSCLENSSFNGGKRVGLSMFTRDDVKDVIGFVKPKAILSGGKIRVITIGSLGTHRLERVNWAAFQEVRKCAWSISGRSVEEWAANADLQGDELISGDLEAATDTFRQSISEAVLDRMVECYDPDMLEVARGCTTRATFVRPKGKLEGRATLDPSNYECIGKQRWGQLMGSEMSFPGLCVVNLIATSFAKPDLAHALDTLRGNSLREFLHGWNKAGINGDDLLTAGSRADAEQWVRGVQAIGGIVSRGKSLMNKRYGTVNSELVERCGSTVKPVNVLRPTLIAGLHDRTYKVPQAQWKEYLDVVDRYPDAERLFRTHITMFPSMPRSWGGMGTRELSYDEFVTSIRDAFALRRFRPAPPYGWLKDAADPSKQVAENGDTRFSVSVLDPSMVAVPRGCAKPQEQRLGSPGNVNGGGWWPKDQVKRLAASIYVRDPNKLRWTSESTSRLDFWETLANADRDARYTTLIEKKALYAEYINAFEADRRGLVYVPPGVLDPYLILDSEPHLNAPVGHGAVFAQTRRSFVRANALTSRKCQTSVVGIINEQEFEPADWNQFD